MISRRFFVLPDTATSFDQFRKLVGKSIDTCKYMCYAEDVKQTRRTSGQHEETER